MRAATIEDEDREALAALGDLLAQRRFSPREWMALHRAQRALLDLIETRERIARRLRTSESDD